MNKKLIYIVGSVPNPITSAVLDRFRRAELDLISFGFRVYNPICSYRYHSYALQRQQKIANLRRLFQCQAVYVLPCAFAEEFNFELRMAALLDLVVLHGTGVYEADSASQSTFELHEDE